ncbi:tetratricopeptide repeat protein [Streptomyces tropicalis]|uniref:Tetratricopeptide repeat protein n=1 Tax=Streptomyces tropicalis TaxID=3034234 RepID=A0ABT6ABA4_9ACTN|nr:tetratricopeptide repeat protein [Streptomyces tropicalis]MDF3301934.1 tetratricopeptide repeat protein [Streptomyces tropicalis]
MSRLSREKKREEKHTVRAAAPAAVPIAVHVPVDGAAASVDGVPVRSTAGEEIQHTVLDHLHRLALATGRPVHATVTDERIGYVVPLSVRGDGSSVFTAEPLRTAPPAPPVPPALPSAGGRPAATGDAPRPTADRATHRLPRAPEPAHAFPEPVQEDAESAQRFPEPAEQPGAAEETPHPVRETAPTFPLRAVQEAPPGGTAPTFPLRAVPDPQPSGGTAPTYALRPIPAVADPARTGGAADPARPADAARPATPEHPEPAAPEGPEAPETSAVQEAPADRPAPGTVTAPTGAFGPPPVMDAPSPAADTPSPVVGVQSPAVGAPAPGLNAQPPVMDAPPAPAPAARPRPAAAPRVPMGSELILPAEPDPKPTPARGFDAVAEAVLGDDPRTAGGPGGALLLAEPLARVNEAVKAGRIEEAAALAEHTVAEASGTLGPEHAEVLRVRELSAYIAYLAADPLRAFTLSLDVARVRRRAGDAEAAYGNVQSAAAAWRAVRDPEEGLRLGRDLIDLWTGLTAEDGPAADDIEQLESARARMGRLTERARRAAPPTD